MRRGWLVNIAVIHVLVIVTALCQSILVVISKVTVLESGLNNKTYNQTKIVVLTE